MLISFQFLTVVLRRVTIAMCVSLAHSSHCILLLLLLLLLDLPEGNRNATTEAVTRGR